MTAYHALAESLGDPNYRALWESIAGAASRYSRTRAA